MNTVSRLIAAAALSAASLSANAELQARPGGMVYDTVRNITWLADLNYAKTSGAIPSGATFQDGRQSWGMANSWASDLVYGGFDDWRLPKALNPNGTGPCLGFRCSGSELGQLFYAELGVSAGDPVSNATNVANLALFTNIQSDFYWSGTERPSSLGTRHFYWIFRMDNGAQYDLEDYYALFAVAVRDGDVAAAVPEPQTNAMLLAGLGALALVMQRRKR